MMICATMASPIAWEHHYAILLPIFAMLSPLMFHHARGKTWLLLLFTLAFVVTAHKTNRLNMLADTPLNILQSYVFFAALTLLAMACYVSKKCRSDNK
jgi:uncharacterized membrane protein YccC